MPKKSKPKPDRKAMRQHLKMLWQEVVFAQHKLCAACVAYDKKREEFNRSILQEVREHVKIHE